MGSGDTFKGCVQYFRHWEARKPVLQRKVNLRNKFTSCETTEKTLFPIEELALQ